MPSLLSKPRTTLLGKPRLYVRARKVRLPSTGLAPIVPIPGLNQAETRVQLALDELGIVSVRQQNILGGSLLGGARADWILPAYRIALEFAGPFHGTTEGRGRDALRNLGVEAQGYRV